MQNDFFPESYNCPKCSETPKILSLYRNSVQLECPTHGKISIEISDYLNEMLKYSYFTQTCNICNKNNQQNNPKNIFKYCPDCNIIICDNCINSHNIKFPTHSNLILSKELPIKCKIHHGNNYTEYCYTCKKNICDQCIDAHKEHDRESLNEMDEDIVSNDISLIEYRKQLLIQVKDNLLKEIKELDDMINFNDLIVNTKKILPQNAYHVQNINIVARDLDSQYVYINKNKQIEELQKQLNDLITLDQVRDKYINEFNNKYFTNIKKDDVEIDLSGKNIKDDGLKLLSKINFDNLKNLILSNNDLTSFKCLMNSTFTKLEILKLDNNRINSIEVLPYLKCFTLKEIHLNNNKLCNIDSLGKLLDFNNLELIDIRDNCFDPDLEKNSNIIKDLKQMIKTVKVDSGSLNLDDYNEPEITDEELNEMLK